MAARLKSFDRAIEHSISPKWLAAKHNHTPNTLSDPRVLELAKRNDVNYMWSKYLKVILKSFLRFFLHFQG